MIDTNKINIYGDAPPAEIYTMKVDLTMNTGVIFRVRLEYLHRCVF